MHKKISHLDKVKDEYKETTARYFCCKKIILEVEECSENQNIGESVDIEGTVYKIIDILNYPELSIIDYTMEVKT